VLDENGGVVCLAEGREDGVVHPRKVFPPG